MKLIHNTGTDRVIDLIRPWFTPGHQLDMVTSSLSLFAFGELFKEAATLRRARLLLPPADADLSLLGTSADRAVCNGLRSRWLAKRLAEWLRDKAEIRRACGPVPQGIVVLRDGSPRPQKVVLGSVAFSTEGLGLAPGNPLSLIHLLRVNVLKRMESAVTSFALTVERQLRDVEATLSRIEERPEDLAGEGDLDLLIATDCISEGQNLQDCDWLINYDIHWNPVRIIQRFGRIDRIGSPNERIQLVNFWPNMELEEYINLEQRVSGRMVLLDISATGEENLIEQQSGNQMNDLEYCRKQLLKLQDAVIDLEDLSTGVSIADLTLTDFRIDLAQYLKAHPGLLERLSPGSFAVTTTTTETEIAPGIIFCLRAEGDAARRTVDAGYPLAQRYLVHVGDDGAVLLPYTQAKQILDRLKRLCLGRDLPDAGSCARFDKATKEGEDMRHAQCLLAVAVASVVGKSEERAVASLFSSGGTHALKGEFAGINDFEVAAYLVVLPEEQG